MGKKRMMLYFGSFNPVHRGHIALAEYAVERDLCDEVAMIISPQNKMLNSWQTLCTAQKILLTKLVENIKHAWNFKKEQMKHLAQSNMA